MFAVSSRRVLPGFTLSLGTSLLFVCLILLLPLSALVMQLAQMSWAQYWEVITTNSRRPSCSAWKTNLAPGRK